MCCLHAISCSEIFSLVAIECNKLSCLLCNSAKIVRPQAVNIQLEWPICLAMIVDVSMYSDENYIILLCLYFVDVMFPVRTVIGELHTLDKFFLMSLGLVHLIHVPLFLSDNIAVFWPVIYGHLYWYYSFYFQFF